MKKKKRNKKVGLLKVRGLQGKHIQTHIQKIVDKYEQHVPLTQIYGVPLTDLTEHELQCLVCWQQDTLQNFLLEKEKRRKGAKKPDIIIVPAHHDIKH